ncbi:NAD-dependent epimerase/dehydratase family protein [Larkinella knui]|uniref:NAD(P)-dependent oxidoreductase n=1 Tax=Larkinella knui TaxID=2025310 RepID=A0A3P1CLL1_9BACT|nr:NAD(P)-dependent oxidoreductase [Larkinella knui]RRB14070.1 NAD(P)-dependent oxidoreductase [Larkinella knui]
MSANPSVYPPTALLTGPNGFLGKYLAQGLTETGYRVLGLGRTAGDVICDLASQSPDLSGKSIDLVVHAAGKAHTVPRNEQESQAFFRINRDGTLRLLEALDQLKTLPSSFVLISTVAVYGCETGENITEEVALLGKSPYAESKIQAEQLVQHWCQERGIRCLILRLPLIVGANAPGNLGKLVRAIRRGRYVHIGSGSARRSMVLAEDVARLIPGAAQLGGIYNLTDGIHPSVRELGDAIAQQTGNRPIPTIPFGLARLLARLGDGLTFLIGRRFPFDSIALTKITGSLTFSDQRARQELGWRPQPVSGFNQYS